MSVVGPNGMPIINERKSSPSPNGRPVSASSMRARTPVVNVTSRLNRPASAPRNRPVTSSGKSESSSGGRTGRMSRNSTQPSSGSLRSMAGSSSSTGLNSKTSSRPPSSSGMRKNNFSNNSSHNSSTATLISNDSTSSLNPRRGHSRTSSLKNALPPPTLPSHLTHSSSSSNYDFLNQYSTPANSHLQVLTDEESDDHIIHTIQNQTRPQPQIQQQQQSSLPQRNHSRNSQHTSTPSQPVPLTSHSSVSVEDDNDNDDDRSEADYVLQEHMNPKKPISAVHTALDNQML